MVKKPSEKYITVTGGGASKTKSTDALLVQGGRRAKGGVEQKSMHRATYSADTHSGDQVALVLTPVQTCSVLHMVIPMHTLNDKSTVYHTESSKHNYRSKHEIV